MSIESSTVRHIARLARIAMSDAELDLAAAEMAGVLTLADQLGAAQIEGIAPLAHPHDQALFWRADVVSEPDRADAFLALAPEARGGLYLVPKVLE
jgi:aspartyl-tRNA(Asn)/glutamyl-tRNA(Gln) amidotransferase subunit C